LIHQGLLYWPFEDSQFSAGRGEFAVTNGKAWRWGLLLEGRAFHVHAMNVVGRQAFCRAISLDRTPAKLG